MLETHHLLTSLFFSHFILQLKFKLNQLHFRLSLLPVGSPEIVLFLPSFAANRARDNAIFALVIVVVKEKGEMLLL